MNRERSKRADGLVIRVLGDVDVNVDGAPIDVDTRKAVALLVYLAVTGTSASRDQLCTLLWPELAPDRARGALRRTLSVLRKALDGRWLTTEGDRVRLDDDDRLWVDARVSDESMASLPTDADRSEPVSQDCEDRLSEVADLHRGEFMAGFSLRDSPDFEDWQLHRADMYRRSHGIVLDLLAEALASQGEYTRAIGVARQRVALAPLDEDAHRQVMLMSVWAGDRAAALRQYRECVRILDEELGVPPLLETSALEESILCDAIPEPPGRHAKVIPATPAEPQSSDGRRLIGRSPERAELQQLLAENGPRIAVITGAPGIGKSRLAEELSDTASVHRRVVRARAYEGEESLGLVVMGEALRTAHEDWNDPPPLDLRAASEASRLVPGLRAEATDRPPAVLKDPGAQSRFFDSVCSVLATLLERDGVLVLDDLQWADTASLDLIAYLARRRERFPIRMVLIWRTSGDGEPHPLRHLVEQMRDEGCAVLIDLAPLADDAVRELTVEVAPGLDRTSTDMVIAESDGIPLVALHYLRLVDAESGTLDANAPARGQLAEVRLRGLGELARQVLSAASVIGRAFDPDEVRAVSGRNDDESLQALEELIRSGLLTEDEHGLVDFSHDLVRRHARESMSAVRRRLLHSRIADHLLRRHGTAPSALSGRTAHHLEEAGRQAEAAECRVAAGDHSRSVFARQEAMRHYQAALALGCPDLVALQTAIGDLHTLDGDYRAALDAYRAASARAGGAELAAIEHRLGEVNGRLGRWDIAVRHFEAARSGLVTPDDLVDLLIDWARIAARMNDSEKARELLEEAAAQPGRQVSRSPMILIMKGLFDTDPTRGERIVCQGLEVARERADAESEAAGLNALALLARQGGHLSVAIERVDAALALVERIGDRHRQAALHDLMADLLHESGHEQAAHEAVTRAVQLFAEVGTGGFEPEIWKTAPW